ncbi:MAG: HD domain-containing protein [Planctomycetaceae bacterium]|nr:HD domain-containing protein [Planctomycetaceae bacterium]
MATAIDTKSENGVPVEKPDLSTVSLNDLIIGRKLQSPLYDEHGVLLLAAGATITQEIKQAIRNRGDMRVCISQHDALHVTLQPQLTCATSNRLVTFDSELTRKIDAIMDAGLLAVKNTGPAVKNDVVFLGRKGYDHDQRTRLIDQHERNGQALGTMMSEALHGNVMDGNVVATMAAEYLKEMTTDTDNVLCSAIDKFQDDDIAGRSLEVALLAMAIGIEMDLDSDNIRNLAMAGLVHDWGMMKVPAEIRNTQHRLNAVEMLEIKKHPIYSLELLQHVSALPPVVSVIAYQVHERFNGTGYPRGRCGTSIHPFARILQVADSFVGMTTPKYYRPPIMRYGAMECLVRQAKERAVDSQVVRALLKIQSLFPIGSYVTLSDGSVAQILRRNQDYYTQPIVARIQDAEGNAVDITAEENVIDLHEAEHLKVEQALPTPGSNEIPLSEDLYQASLAFVV